MLLLAGICVDFFIGPSTGYVTNNVDYFSVTCECTSNTQNNGSQGFGSWSVCVVRYLHIFAASRILMEVGCKLSEGAYSLEPCVADRSSNCNHSSMQCYFQVFAMLF